MQLGHEKAWLHVDYRASCFSCCRKWVKAARKNVHSSGCIKNPTTPPKKHTHQFWRKINKKLHKAKERGCWLLLYSMFLPPQTDSPPLHVILHEWIAFYSMLLNIHHNGVLTPLTWLGPHETAAILAHSVYTMQPCTTSLHAKPHM